MQFTTTASLKRKGRIINKSRPHQHQAGDLLGCSKADGRAPIGGAAVHVEPSFFHFVQARDEGLSQVNKQREGEELPGMGVSREHQIPSRQGGVVDGGRLVRQQQSKDCILRCTFYGCKGRSGTRK